MCHYHKRRKCLTQFWPSLYPHAAQRASLFNSTSESPREFRRQESTTEAWGWHFEVLLVFSNFTTGRVEVGGGGSVLLPGDRGVLISEVLHILWTGATLYLRTADCWRSLPRGGATVQGNAFWQMELLLISLFSVIVLLFEQEWNEQAEGACEKNGRQGIWV